MQLSFSLSLMWLLCQFERTVGCSYGSSAWHLPKRRLRVKLCTQVICFIDAEHKVNTLVRIQDPPSASALASYSKRQNPLKLVF